MTSSSPCCTANDSSREVDLSVRLGRLQLANPVMVGSGTFGLGWELSRVVDLARLGAIIPKTVTKDPRKRQPPPRTVETPAGLLNSIGLDNDGIDVFLDHHLPRLRSLGCPVIVSIAGKSVEEFGELASRVEAVAGVAGLELNISCPNVAGGVDYATDPVLCARVVGLARSRSSLPILAKLTPNVTNIVVIARAAWEAGADAVVIANTLLGMSVDWRGRRARLGGILGGHERAGRQARGPTGGLPGSPRTAGPHCGLGGIGTIDDCMEIFGHGGFGHPGRDGEFLPSAGGTWKSLERLPAAVQSLGASSVREIVGSLRPLQELRAWKPLNCSARLRGSPKAGSGSCLPARWLPERAGPRPVGKSRSGRLLSTGGKTVACLASKKASFAPWESSNTPIVFS